MSSTRISKTEHHRDFASFNDTSTVRMYLTVSNCWPRRRARVGYVQPITLYPFPAVAAAADTAQVVAVHEQNTGQMIDDVRLAVLGKAPVRLIGVTSYDSSGFGIGPDIEVPEIRRRIEAVID